jgi:tetratricopeptide (TPR) repeat protein
MSDIQRHLRAAIGFIELGMLEDAVSELESVPPEDKNRRDVLEVRLEIYRESKAWSLMEVVARELLKRQPDDPDDWNNLAFSIRRKDSVKAAQTLLLEALEKFPNDAMIRYNLGCYACQLGDLEEAKKLVGDAIRLDAKYKLLAIDDPDLEPLWQQIGSSKIF